MIQRRNRRGNSLLEFTLVGIPVIFVLISTFELARGMWVYHTLAYALKEATRYTVVHGNNCQLNNNSCYIQIRNVAQVIQDAGIGLDPAQLANVKFISTSRTITCSTLAACLQTGATGDTYWPSYAPGSPTPDPGGQVGAPIQITAQYPFASAISMLFPSAGGMVFPMFTFPGESGEEMRF